MVDPEMLRITQVNQAVVTAPGIGMNDRFNPDTPVDNSLQRFLLDVRDNLGKDFPVSFIDAEDDGFTVRAATAFAFDPFSSEVGFVDLDLADERRFALTILSQAMADFQEDLIDCLMSQSGQQSRSISG